MADDNKDLKNDNQSENPQADGKKKQIEERLAAIRKRQTEAPVEVTEIVDKDKKLREIQDRLTEIKKRKVDDLSVAENVTDKKEPLHDVSVSKEIELSISTSEHSEKPVEVQSDVSNIVLHKSQMDETLGETLPDVSHVVLHKSQMDETLEETLPDVSNVKLPKSQMDEALGETLPDLSKTDLPKSQMDETLAETYEAGESVDLSVTKESVVKPKDDLLEINDEETSVKTEKKGTDEIFDFKKSEIEQRLAAIRERSKRESVYTKGDVDDDEDDKKTPAKKVEVAEISKKEVKEEIKTTTVVEAPPSVDEQRKREIKERLAKLKREETEKLSQPKPDRQPDEVVTPPTEVIATTVTTTTTETKTVTEPDKKETTVSELTIEKSSVAQDKNLEVKKTPTEKEVKDKSKLKEKTITTTTTETTETTDVKKVRRISLAWILAAAIVVVLIVIAIVVFLNRDRVEKYVAEFTESTSIGSNTDDNTSETDETISNNLNPVTNNSVTTADNSANKTNENIVKPETRIDDKWGLKRPCWVISYASLTKEESAVKEVQRLKTKGYKAGYYYIPDYKPGGHTLYKIYIGPFNTANEPNSIIAAIKQLSKDAYILKVE